MIRINLLGQARPKAAKQSVPLEATLQIILGLAAIAIAAIVLFITYNSEKRELDDTNARIASLKAEAPSSSRSSRKWTPSNSRSAPCKLRSM